jgi:hypothetical protein
MTTVLMLVPVSTATDSYRAGQQYSLDDTLAAQWIVQAWAAVPPTPATGDPTLCIQFTPTITAVAGAGGLENLVTSGERVPQVQSFDVAGEPHEWELIAGTDVSDGVNFQRPTDYNVSTNAVVWRRRR